MARVARLQELEALTDDQLRESTRQAFRREEVAQLDVLYHLVEVERRRLHLRDGYPSLFEYAKAGLGYSRGGAARRIACARAIGRFPSVHEALLSGRMTMSGIAIVARVLAEENVEEVLARAADKSQEELEALAASYRPVHGVPERIEPIAVRATPAEGPGPGQVEARFKVVFSMDPETRAKFEQVRSLLSGKLAGQGQATIEAIFEILLEEYLQRHCPVRRQRRREARRARGMKEAPGAPAAQVDAQAEIDESTSPVWCRRRYLEPELRDAVYVRDGGRCTYVSPDGRRCASTFDLEIDHMVPLARTLTKPRLEDLRLLCRVHNQEAARRAFGDDEIDRAIYGRRHRSGSAGSSSVSGSG